MTCQDNEIVLNNVLIEMARSFLQYVSESSPWIGTGHASIGKEVDVLALRQRQDVAEVVALLTEREYHIDFGSYPTEYTDQQFLSLESLIAGLRNGQTKILAQLANAEVSLRTAGDEVAADLCKVLESHERDLAQALPQIASELHSASL